jgi:hypothetical protein
MNPGTGAAIVDSGISGANAAYIAGFTVTFTDIAIIRRRAQP